MKCKFALLLLLAAFIFPANSVLAEENEPIEIYLFVQQGCPHCATIEKQLKKWKSEKYPEIDMRLFNIVEGENIKLLLNAQNAYNFQSQGIPVLFIGEEYIVGANIEQLENAILNCKENFCPKPSEIIQNYIDRQAKKASEGQVMIENQEQNTKNTKTTIIIAITVAAILIFVYIQFISNKNK